MSDKPPVFDPLDHLPVHVTPRNAAEEIEFVAGVGEGFDQLDRGEGVSIDAVEGLISGWATR